MSVNESRPIGTVPIFTTVVSGWRIPRHHLVGLADLDDVIDAGHLPASRST
jgi:hypothetical protein